MYTAYWFQSMAVGDNPAPSAIAPRLMDAILLDGHLGVRPRATPDGSCSPAAFKVPSPRTQLRSSSSSASDCSSLERELLKLAGDGLADAAHTAHTLWDNVDALMEKAHEYSVSNKVVLGAGGHLMTKPSRDLHEVHAQG